MWKEERETDRDRQREESGGAVMGKRDGVKKEREGFPEKAIWS